MNTSSIFQRFLSLCPRDPNYDTIAYALIVKNKYFEIKLQLKIVILILILEKELKHNLRFISFLENKNKIKIIQVIDLVRKKTFIS